MKKQKPLVLPLAQSYIDNGYLACDTDLYRVRDEIEDEGGGLFRWHYSPGNTEPWHPDLWDRGNGETFVELSCGVRYRHNLYGPGREPQDSDRLAAVRIRVDGDAELAASIERLIAPRLVWADGVTPRHNPVRETIGSADLLMVFRFDGHWDGIGATSEREDRPRNQQASKKRVTVSTAGDFFCPAGSAYRWRDGDLTTVKRDELPVMDWEIADAITNEARALIEPVD